MKYNKVMLEEIETDILNAKYEQVAKKFKNMSDEDIHDIIYFNIADRTESLSVYGFTQYMFKKTGNTIIIFIYNLILYTIIVYLIDKHILLCYN